jgi:hypothetical protein
MGQEVRTRQALQALDNLTPPRPFDPDAGLASLRSRIAAEPDRIPWWDRLRPLLWPAVATAAAAAVAVTLLYEPVQTPSPRPDAGVARSSDAEAGKTAAPADDGLDNLVDLVEELPLFEEFELFSQHETLAELAAADDATLDQLLAEVGG